MSRAKGKENTAQPVIDEIVKRHEKGESVPALAKAYEMPFKTVKNMIYRERRKSAFTAKGYKPLMKLDC